MSGMRGHLWTGNVGIHKKGSTSRSTYVVAFLNPSIRCNEFLLSRSVSICQWQVVYRPPTHT